PLVPHHAHPLFSPFFLLPRPPPRSTLVPYTTLFRSHLVLARHDQDGEVGVAVAHALVELGQRLRLRQLAVLHLEDDPPARGSAADRKSTRLNSSHVAISYAVFCLKKKKKKSQQTVYR